MEFIGIIMMAIIVEGLITYVKEFFVNGKFQWQMLVSIAIWSILRNGIPCGFVPDDGNAGDASVCGVRADRRTDQPREQLYL